MSETRLHVYGIRHHGPGSARALLAALASFAPDCVLVEGPPEGDDLIRWLAHPALVMPVALLVYRPDEPRRGVFYPFADFSPEYRALRYAIDNGVAVGFMDLPRRHTLAIDEVAAMPPADPFRLLAAAAGHDNYDSWWNAAVEQSGDGTALFEAVLSLAAELRGAAGPPEDTPGAQWAERREAAMRRRIRRAAAEGHRRIAAVCGAWHAPALVDAHRASGAANDALLSDLPAVEVAAAWLPWTYGRLAQSSGYGAGIASPGWYDHLWRAEEGIATVGWLARAAALLREEGMDTSPGHVIEAARLAEALAALRRRPFPGLPELEEAALSAMCGGDEEPMRLIRRRLIVGERMGLVPPDAPATPLQRDLAARQARLKLRPEPEPSTLKLDLRSENHLERSRLLHQLGLLDVPWGTPAKPKGQAAGALTPGAYVEFWQLHWTPELSVRVIEASMWGNTVRDAAAARAEDKAAHLTELPALTQLIDQVVLADLPEAMTAVLARIEALSAVEHYGGHAQVAHMLATLPPLAHALRYGGPRRTAEHLPALRRVFDHLLTRACLALPRVCVSLDEKAAADLIDHLSAAAPVVRLTAGTSEHWREALGALADRPAIHPAVAGRATRLLHEEAALPAGGVVTRLERALTGDGSAAGARYAADWLDGFLRDSGLLLVHDRPLWSAVDGWLVGLADERFAAILPLLRRTFATYPDGVRQQLQERLHDTGRVHRGQRAESGGLDAARAAAVLPALGRLLGIAPDAMEAGR